MNEPSHSIRVGRAGEDELPPLDGLLADRIDIAGGTHVGRVRARNDDLFFIADLDRWIRDPRALPAVEGMSAEICSAPGKLFVVAEPAVDDEASRARSLAICEELMRDVIGIMPVLLRADDPARVSLELHRAYDRAAGDAASEVEVMLAYLRWPDLFTVGRSQGRAYVLHRETLAPLAEATHVRLRAGDGFLLCSDGLTSQVSEEAIAQHMYAGGSAAAVCQGLLRIANRAGGADNTTVIVARC